MKKPKPREPAARRRRRYPLPRASAYVPPRGPVVPLPPDALIHMERTACFGDCPTYMVTIEASGAVFFKGRHPARGCALRKVPRAAVEKLIARIRASNYFRLKQRYGRLVSDHPEARLSITLAGRTHRILHSLTDRFAKGADADERRQLAAIEREIDAVAGTKNWLRKGASPLPNAVVLTSQQIEKVAARRAPELVQRCPVPPAKPIVEFDVRIDSNQLASDPSYTHWWPEQHVSLPMAQVHPALKCMRKQIATWRFPRACGVTVAHLRLDSSSKPPKIDVGKPRAGAR